MSLVRVHSEIGPLRAVLVHTPGKELLAVTPGSLSQYLYDDVIDLEAARSEHRSLVRVLERFATVLEVRTLFTDVLADATVRRAFVDRTIARTRSDALAQRMEEMSASTLANVMIEGSSEEPGPLARLLNTGGSILPALPNLFFTRDVGIVIGDKVVIGAMRFEARWSEELLIKALFGHHSDLQNGGIVYDGSNEQRLDHSLEGGDVHPVREDLLVVGLSDRTSAAALDTLCEAVFRNSAITDIVIVVLSGESTAIHLDMLFTQIDRDQCVVSPPHFMGPERLPVLHRRKGSSAVRECADFFQALRLVEYPLDPIRCGGGVRANQEREQWASGCNLFTVSPGVAIAYQRNEQTLRECEAGGYRIVEAETFLTQKDPDVDTRQIITVRGSELVRGGGGPRCMTSPVVRDDP